MGLRYTTIFGLSGIGLFSGALALPVLYDALPSDDDAPSSEATLDVPAIQPKKRAEKRPGGKPTSGDTKELEPQPIETDLPPPQSIFLTDLPPECLIEILELLEARALLRMKRVGRGFAFVPEAMPTLHQRPVSLVAAALACTVNFRGPRRRGTLKHGRGPHEQAPHPSTKMHMAAAGGGGTADVRAHAP